MTNTRLTWIALSIVGLSFVTLIFVVGAFAMLGDTGVRQIFNPPPSPTPIPETSTPAPAAIEGLVWHDQCASGRQGEAPPSVAPAGCVKLSDGADYRANGIYEAGEVGLSDINVRLGLGLCPSTGLMASVTDASGAFRFAALPAGTYCVSIDPGEAPHAASLLPGNWTYPASSSGSIATTVTVTAGETRSGLSFGWDPLFLPEPPQITPSPTPAPPTPTAPVCINRATFVADVSIPDNTNLRASQAFEKIWRMRNNGTCIWTTAQNLVFVSGHSMGAPITVPLSGDVEPGKTVDLKVKMVAPAVNGTYRGNWMLSSTSGALFGIGENGDKPFWVQVVVGPVSAGGPLSWRAEYFSNRSLKGTPELVRYDGLIDFNWKKNAPASVLPVDNFSVRWTTKAEFEAATYRFKLSMNDGARLFFDDKLVLDAWQDGNFREQKAELALARGTHSLRLEYYEHRGEARILLKWEKVSSPSFPDWKAEYWNNRDLSGSPALIRNDKKIAHDWRTKAPAVGIMEDHFSARWTRSVNFEGGSYRFKARSDDGVRIYVDGKLILDEWHTSDAAQTYSKKVKLSSGKHKVVVEYYERTGKAYIEVWWEHIVPTPTATATVSPTVETPVTSETSPPPEPEIVFNFIHQMCTANWQTGAGSLPCPGTEDDSRGAVYQLANPTLETGSQSNKPALITRPEVANLGWIKGVFPALTVLAGDQFKTTIGCLDEKPACEIEFKLSVLVSGEPAQSLGSWQEKSDGNVRQITIDLSSFAGKQVIFIFEVSSENASSFHHAFWLQPAIWR